MRSVDFCTVAYSFANIMSAIGLLRPFSSNKEKLYVSTIAKTNIYELWSKFDNNQIVPEIELVRSEVDTNFIEKELSNLGVKLGEDFVFESNLSG